MDCEGAGAAVGLGGGGGYGLPGGPYCGGFGGGGGGEGGRLDGHSAQPAPINADPSAVAPTADMARSLADRGSSSVPGLVAAAAPTMSHEAPTTMNTTLHPRRVFGTKASDPLGQPDSAVSASEATSSAAVQRRASVPPMNSTVRADTSDRA